MSALAIRLDTVGPRLVLSLTDASGNIRASGDVEFDIEPNVSLPAILKALNADAYDANDYSDDEREYLRAQGYLEARDGAEAPSFSRALRELIGDRLFALLFPNEDMRTAFSVAGVAQDGLELDLCFSEDSDVVSVLPWELLRNKQKFLVNGSRGTLTRCLELSKKAPRWKAMKLDRLRVLLVSPRPSRLAPLGDGEREAIESVDRVTVDRLNPPTIEALATYLLEHHGETGPHVIHFDGHGMYGRRCRACRWLNPRLAPICQNPTCGGLSFDKPQGYLAWEQPDGGLQWVSAEAFANQIGDTTRRPDSCLRLVVVSACRSAEATGGPAHGGSAFSGVAQRLIEANVPAVMAMQFEIRADHAAALARAFYTGVVRNEPLPRALSWARMQIESLDIDQWYCPVMYLRAGENREGRFFNLLPQLTDTRPITLSYMDQPEPLNLPPLVPDHDPVETARWSLTRIARQVDRDTKVASMLRDHADTFAGTAIQLQIMSDYKDLHDHLHRLYHGTYGPLRDDLDYLDDSPHVQVIFGAYERQAQMEVAGLQKVERQARNRVPSHVLSWIGDVERIDLDLRAGIDRRDRDEIEDALGRLDSLLTRRSVQINERLFSTAGSLHIERVSRALRAVDRDRDAIQGAYALDTLWNRLKPLVDEHNLWQELDLDLRQLGSDLDASVREIATCWPDRRARILALCEGHAREEVGRLREACADVDTALDRAAHVRVGKQAEALQEVRSAYKMCERQAGLRFFNVDSDLKALCDQLQELRGPMGDLAQALRAVPV